MNAESARRHAGACKQELSVPEREVARAVLAEDCIISSILQIRPTTAWKRGHKRSLYRPGEASRQKRAGVRSASRWLTRAAPMDSIQRIEDVFLVRSVHS